MSDLHRDGLPIDLCVLTNPKRSWLLMDSADSEMSLIILFLSKTGCRIAEALNLKFGDIQETDNAVELTVIGKGEKARPYSCPSHQRALWHQARLVWL